MNKDQEIDLLRDLQSLAIDCSNYAEGKITSEKMAFYCKNIADSISKLLQELASVHKEQKSEGQ